MERQDKRIIGGDGGNKIENGQDVKRSNIKRVTSDTTSLADPPED